jgi:hypothetical protein
MIVPSEERLNAQPSSKFNETKPASRKPELTIASAHSRNKESDIDP